MQKSMRKTPGVDPFLPFMHTQVIMHAYLHKNINTCTHMHYIGIHRNTYNYNIKNPEVKLGF